MNKHISTSSAWTWAVQGDLLINHNKWSCLIVGKLQSLSAVDVNLSIAPVTCVRDLGLPMIRFSSYQCITECTMNTARQLLFVVRRSLAELSKAAFIPLYCAIVRAHLDYAMKANFPNLRADTNHLERVPAPWNTICERPPSLTIWGKASPTPPFLTGTQMHSSWPHPGLHNFHRPD